MLRNCSAAVPKGKHFLLYLIDKDKKKHVLMNTAADLLVQNSAIRRIESAFENFHWHTF
jgi:hypothetical protein